MKTKILIIDDEPDILNTLETLLTAEGFYVRKAPGGRQALEIFQSEPFDLVITDIRMPEMDGLEVIKSLKGLDQDIEIIVLSAFATIDNAIEALHEDGAFDFLRKPLENIDALFHTVRQALEKRRLRIQNRRLLEELRKHGDHLEELVAQRTTELQQAQRLEAIGTLAGGIAHDFNNIICAILGNATLALDNVSRDSLAYDDIDQIITAGKRASDLVQQILTFSGQNKTERKPLALQAIVKEALKLLGGLLPETIKIRQQIDANCGSILADPTQIHQVVMNLATNAFHAMHEQDGVLEVCVKEVEVTTERATKHQDLTPGRYVRLAVKDTGDGMNKATMERIFDPFFTTKKIGDGTGMGLSTVLGIVKNHNAVITVQSEPGQGTCFEVFFPRY